MAWEEVLPALPVRNKHSTELWLNTEIQQQFKANWVNTICIQRKISVQIIYTLVKSDGIMMVYILTVSSHVVNFL